MNDECNKKCAALERLEQQMEDMRHQNGSDHKDLRTRLSKVELDSAKQFERFDRIIDNLIDLKNDNKELLLKVGELSSQADDIVKLEKDVEEIKGRDGKTWVEVKSKVLSWGIALLLGLLAAALGLSQYL